MPKSLAELTAGTPSRPERPATVVVGDGVKFLVEITNLQTELEDLLRERMAEPGAARGPRKMGEGADVIELQQKIAAAADAMGEYEGRLTVRATRSDGEWRQWVDKHPPRAEGEPGRNRDVELTGFDDGTRTWARCNADALLDDLATYVVAWEDEPLAEGQFDALGVSPPDKKILARTVIGIYEDEAVDIPKWRRGLSGMQTSAPSSS
ncbi:hypothetical protein [Nocardioides bruguierae]|uniref:Uncharacterized protein n=1 Tax=Nocardioides bruguierae TaxID=2945102 RepID=A0A9X2IIE0_9ACTN|nr:hypothetical protein [Nocardioides bruguierae]MCM0622720.1 hypothetical protein [Nocardioides bruguierae]